MIRNLIPLGLASAIAAVAAIVDYFRPDLRPREKGEPPQTGRYWADPENIWPAQGSGQVGGGCGGGGAGGGDSGSPCDGGG